MKERRQRLKRTLANQLLSQISIWFVFLLTLITGAVFYLTYQQEQQEYIQSLQSDIQRRIEHKSAPLRRTESSAQILAERFLSAYRRSDPETQARVFDQWHQQTEPGVMRLKPAFYKGTEQEGDYYQSVSTFVGPRQTPLTTELKARTVIAEKVLNELGPAWEPWVLNTHLSMPENILALYSPDSPWGLQAAADLVITDFSVVRSTLQSQNPNRTPNWTGLYYDISAGHWTLTYQRPIDHQGQHLANASHDVDLTRLVEDLIQPIVSKTRHYIVNRDGLLIASDTLPAEKLQKDGTVKLAALGNAELTQAFEVLSALKSGQNLLTDTNTLDDHLLIAMNIDGPNWWHLTLYPKEQVRLTALQVPLFLTLVALTLLLVTIIIVRILIRRHVATPLHQLANLAEQVGKEQYQQVLSDNGSLKEAHGEIGLVARSFKTTAIRLLDTQQHLETMVEQRTEELAKANSRLDRLAHLDGLTKLMNRRAFDRDLALAIANAATTPVALALGDLDKFKPYNDNYGHQAGDIALQQVARALVDAKVGKVYRYGGEEIAILIDAPSHAKACENVELCRQRIEALGISHQHQPNDRQVLTLSFGVIQLTPDRNATSQIKEVDGLLYEAKAQGGNCVCCRATP